MDNLIYIERLDDMVTSLIVSVKAK